jgi:hypothetical protein
MATDTVTAPPATADAPPPDGAAPVAAARTEEHTPTGTTTNGAGKDKAKGGKDKAAKGGKGDKKSKGAKKGSEDADASADGPNIAAHPRAVRGIARAKSWGGLAGFVLGGYLSMPTNTLAGAGVRALIAGIACYVVVWAGAVFLWRRLVILEIKGREQELAAALLAARTRAELGPAAGDRPTAKAGAQKG